VGDSAPSVQRPSNPEGDDTTRLGEEERVGDARLPRAARAPHAVDVLLRRVREVVERPRGLFETGV